MSEQTIKDLLHAVTELQLSLQKPSVLGSHSYSEHFKPKSSEQMKR